MSTVLPNLCEKVKLILVADQLTETLGVCLAEERQSQKGKKKGDHPVDFYCNLKIW